MGERFLAPQAWLDGAWARDVLLCVDEQGCWSAVRGGATEDERHGARLLPGPVVPALVNAHSHAFQRAIVGLTERRGSDPHDDFWSWRDRMYA
ncbi:MAG: formimidoylglutamate deiminase, partial [Rhodoferax sp.]|nr:formimidoylglutamate deiminase [Rhodoferax sp.]